MKQAGISENARRLYRKIEPVLSYALEKESAGAALACRAYLKLHAPPEHRLYNPATFLKKAAAKLGDDGHQVHAEPVADECVGAPDLLLLCLRTLVKAAELEEDSCLNIELFEEEERRQMIPRIAVSLDGPGRIPEEFVFQRYFRMTLDELGAGLTLGAQGGRIDRMENGVMLRLSGMRMPPETLPEAEGLLGILGRKPEAQHVAEALAHIDGESKRGPADLRAILSASKENYRAQLEGRGIGLEVMVEPGSPPLSVRRPRIEALFDTIFEYALWWLDPKGAVVFLVEYEAKPRQLVVIATVTGKERAPEETFHFASLRRCVSEHGGSLDVSVEGHEAAISILLPDLVGAALDTWIPGWEAFTEKSKQMLRMLKSGGAPVPEDFVLGGVLEEELEAWLLPRLASPAAVNIANELKPDRSPLPTSDPDRLRKAIAQVARGKPKKEICKPSYAGELLWAFREGYRERSALASECMSEEDLQLLCESLLSTPPAYAACLRLAAQVRQVHGAGQ